MSTDPRTHYVYRCFDKAGALLYIGCSMRPEERIAQHKDLLWSSNPASGYLYEHMASWTKERYPNKATARAAEKAAIEAEAPLLNMHHNKGRGLPRVKREPPTLDEMRDALQKLSDVLGLGSAEQSTT